jgi:glutamine amidotransferase
MIKNISIIDYNVGNVRSVINAFKFFGCNVELTDNEYKINSSDCIILPGVGSYLEGMNSLNKKNLISIIKNFSNTGKPVMGICLGMQLLMSESYEFVHTQGTGLISGKVDFLGTKIVPHIGWESVLFDDNTKEDMFFCHSYTAFPTNKKEIYATTEIEGKTFCAAIKKDNIIGFQFHPEKSGSKGLDLIKKFIEERL